MERRLRQEALLRSFEARRTLDRLCEQLRDRFPLRITDGEAVVQVGASCCRLCAASDRMILFCEAMEEASLVRIRTLLEAHLHECACCDGAHFVWSPFQITATPELSTFPRAPNAAWSETAPGSW